MLLQWYYTLYGCFYCYFCLLFATFCNLACNLLSCSYWEEVGSHFYSEGNLSSLSLHYLKKFWYINVLLWLAITEQQVICTYKRIGLWFVHFVLYSILCVQLPVWIPYWASKMCLVSCFSAVRSTAHAEDYYSKSRQMGGWICGGEEMYELTLND